VLSEFARLSKVAVEFDSLFGTHQKVIETLERYEKDKAMQQLMDKVDSLQEQLLFTFSNQSNPDVKSEQKGFVISTIAEQEVLQKVRSYIRLNQDY
jgi:predicted metal-binding transcription factor (methanogenesis marker protein 9)